MSFPTRSFYDCYSYFIISLNCNDIQNPLMIGFYKMILMGNSAQVPTYPKKPPAGKHIPDATPNNAISHPLTENLGKTYEMSHGHPYNPKNN